VTTTVAFLAFGQIPADAILLETGLGGRYDATNVIAKPSVTALSSISMDHMQYLGDTLAKIAGEKAAIMKKGVPCVSVAQPDDAMDVIGRAAVEIGAPLYVQGDTWRIERDAGGLLFTGANNTWKTAMPALLGRHQIGNAGLALAALEQAPFAIPAFALRAGMRNVDWPARAQRLKVGPLVRMLPAAWDLWLDGGHNAGGGAALAALAAEEWADAPLHLVCGMLSTKVADDYLRPLAQQAASFTAVPIAASDAALPPAELAEAARRVGMKDVRVAGSPAEAIASLEISGRARVMICGSLYLAGEILRDNS